ncbi:hypothetical protein ACXC9Q_29360 [Kribbella sp. CWNU-51]
MNGTPKLVVSNTLGSGARLFDGGDHIPLELVSCTPFSTGVLHTVYRSA